MRFTYPPLQKALQSAHFRLRTIFPRFGGSKCLSLDMAAKPQNDWVDDRVHHKIRLSKPFINQYCATKTEKVSTLPNFVCQRRNHETVKNYFRNFYTGL